MKDYKHSKFSLHFVRILKLVIKILHYKPVIIIPGYKICDKFAEVPHGTVLGPLELVRPLQRTEVLLS